MTPGHHESSVLKIRDMMQSWRRRRLLLADIRKRKLRKKSFNIQPSKLGPCIRHRCNQLSFSTRREKTYRKGAYSDCANWAKVGTVGRPCRAPTARHDRTLSLIR